MAATYLSMTQNVASDAGYAGNIAALSAATGDAVRIARFVREACSYIESLWGDWRFLWGGIYEGVTVANTKTIIPPENLYRWDRDRMMIGDKLIYPIQFNDLEWFPNMDQPGYVCNLVVMPDNSLRMYPYPDVDTNYYLSWYKNPMTLVSDLDEPNIPDKFRKIIEAYALWLYAMYDDSAELAAKSEAEYTKWLMVLEADQRPGGLPSNQSYGNHIIISPE